MRDRLSSGAAAFLFSISLRMAGIAMPLLMVESGQAVTTVGLLVGAAGVAQLSIRPFMARMLRVWSDWTLVVLAAVLLTASVAIVLIAPTFTLLLISQLAQGVSRALFWTSNQTHAVRRTERAAGAMAWVNSWSAVGQLIGPAVCGAVLVVSLDLAVLTAAAVAALVLIPALLLDRLPPFPAKPAASPGLRHRVVWLRPTVFAGCWASAIAGVIEAVSGSYLALLLVGAGHSPAMAGVAISIGNAGGLFATALVGRVTARWTTATLRLSVTAVAGGLALSAACAHILWLAVLGLVLSGAGSGILRTLGPAVASDAVHPDERGDAMTASGSFRAVALFAAPFAIGGLLTAVALPAAMITVAAILGLGAIPGGGTSRPEESPA